ncbi:MAG: carbamoyltransferase HypF [Limisphaerales bacterium]
MAAELNIAGSRTRSRLKMSVRGAVQGVGFRPFVYRLATELGLTGWVNNSAQGVWIEVEGTRDPLEEFLLRVETEKPPRSFIQSLEATWLDGVGYTSFEIRPSESGGEKSALVLPDVATCPECVREVFDPANRRYFYPFTNCTNCGPRFSIIQGLPYDRASTSMKAFAMCPECQAEYGDPRDRRFHAQPNACPVCGPQLALWDGVGKSLLDRNASSRDMLGETAAAIRAGKIVAVKGLGGFQLLVAAHDEQAIERLRSLKHREEKPFAVMVPSMEAATALCEISPAEKRLLGSPEAPIVLLRRRARHDAMAASLSEQIAPGNPYLGVMLPYTPLHHLLLSMISGPVVATSGNLKDEPICIEEQEALERLGNIADVFLVHNRPIVRHVDDSIARIVAGRELLLRRARGFAPLPFQFGTAERAARSILGVGAHLKNTVALGHGQQVFVSQHIGDLETDQAFAAFQRVITDFEALFETKPETVVADAHPDYLSTKFAQELATRRASTKVDGAASPDRGPELLSVQHHFAHVLSCMAENEIEPPLLGVSWDGTGYGLDGTVWG